MAAEENQVQDGPVGTETLKNPSVEGTSDALNHTHEDSRPKDASRDQATESEPVEEAKPTEQGSSPATSNDKGPLTEDKLENIKTGDKREHDSTALPDTDKPAAEDLNEPQPKKQKIDEKADNVANGASGTTAKEDETRASETNGEKKKPGRPKKTREPSKKPIPTDGIGSRTRSRTKAT
ncbi:hypothetical protein PHISCL_08477 [Aspergillus sclerotialis]|uniref:Uncharacterized protein n=1 Tax=Aspergillus sclerotialis TaxID=2070753 RepID=A0A3A2Z9A8_9EURO|nr:hypothetical protein PHISCL_08477 [Aspergillus sclerotialis]